MKQAADLMRLRHLASLVFKGLTLNHEDLLAEYEMANKHYLPLHEEWISTCTHLPPHSAPHQTRLSPCAEEPLPDVPGSLAPARS